MRAFWNMAPCILIAEDRRLRRAYCLHHHGDEGAACERFAAYVEIGRYKRNLDRPMGKTAIRRCIPDTLAAVRT
jgi:hypothetical protein